MKSLASCSADSDDECEPATPDKTMFGLFPLSAQRTLEDLPKDPRLVTLFLEQLFEAQKFSA